MEASMYEVGNSEARPGTAGSPAAVSTAAVSTAEDVLGALKWRYATKIFDPQRPASEADVQVILEAIRLAPTSHGLQPFQVIVVTDPISKAAMHKAAYKQRQIETAPHILVFVADKNIRKNADKIIANLQNNKVAEEKIAVLRKNIVLGDIIRRFTFSRLSFAAQQAYIALGIAVMAAAQLRVDACPMGGFFAGKIAKALGLPSHQRPVGLLALGYRASDDKSHPKYRLPMRDLVIYR
jgi:nitroreductase